MDEPAKAAGITLFNEIGLDPGIDHMLALQCINEVHNKGGKVREGGWEGEGREEGGREGGREKEREGGTEGGREGGGREGGRKDRGREEA